MKKLLYILVLVLVLTGCGKTETDNSKQVKIEEDKKSVEEDVTSEKEILDAEDVSGATNAEDSQSTANTTVVQEPSNDASSNNDITTKPNSGSTTKPSTGSANNNSGSANNSGNTGNTSSNNSGTTTQPSTPVHEHKWTEVVEEEIHYYAWRTICGKCNTDLTDMTGTDRAYHTTVLCRSGYSTHYIEVDFVTENVIKTPVVTGYKCECGAEK